MSAEFTDWARVLGAGDKLQAQAALDRFVNQAHDFVIDGESYRKRRKPGRPA